MRKRFSKDEIQEICQMYSGGIGENRVAKHFHVRADIIRRILKEQNISIRSFAGHGENRRIFFDQHYFDNVDDEHRYYWLKFWCADGTVRRSFLTARLKLAVQDKVHLVQFSSTIGYPIDNLKYGREGNSDFVLVALNSKIFVKGLIDHGCVINKRYRLGFFYDVDPILYHHGVRGYFDGDGCISIDKIKVKGEVVFVGCEQMLLAIREIIKIQCGIFTEKLHKSTHSKCYSLSYGGINQIRAIYNYMYSDATVYLERKKNKFEELFENRRLAKMKYRKSLYSNMVCDYSLPIVDKQEVL